jgi:hypothetical protein
VIGREIEAAGLKIFTCRNQSINLCPSRKTKYPVIVEMNGWYRQSPKFCRYVSVIGKKRGERCVADVLRWDWERFANQGRLHSTALWTEAEAVRHMLHGDQMVALAHPDTRDGG